MIVLFVSTLILQLKSSSVELSGLYFICR